MRLILSALLIWLSSLFSSLFASPEGDYENRLREAVLAGDRDQVTAVCKEWYASGLYSAGLLNWNYNELMSVEQNALLFTQQESDTYPAMLLQNAMDIRPDVRVISFQLLENQQYRNYLINKEGLLWIPKDCSMAEFLSGVIKPKYTPGRPVYFGSMTNRTLLQADKEKLFLTGLALKFSATAFDNVATLRFNYENRFHTDYLDLNFAPESDPATVARVNLNYVPALVLLHRHYSATGESDKAARIQNLAIRIGVAGNRESEVRAFFEPESTGADIISAMSPKTLEKGMKKISGNLYAAETELTNGQYEAFLTDLLKNKDFEQLSICRTEKTDWISLLPKEFQNLPEKQIFEHGHPDGPGFPVQNISHDAAQRYCAWITKVYNASPEKKKFKKVIFRLPTEAEWMTAARGGFKDNPYPWGGYYVRNAKGCYLGNYDAKMPCGDCPGQGVFNNVPLNDDGKTNPSAAAKQSVGSSNDGGFFPVLADSYFPNNLGLYAVSGNVAEMIDEPGKTKGGSWQDEPYYGQITPVKIHEGPSPAVGFRVFMEVIEE